MSRRRARRLVPNLTPLVLVLVLEISRSMLHYMRALRKFCLVFQHISLSRLHMHGSHSSYCQSVALRRRNAARSAWAHCTDSVRSRCPS
ncbi:hypothetical protein B0H14DRAFT_2963572 [Mycena olivaceomarginata]|nr:hypothetical protein B0H14DRAFT_2963572 [Mycena olivaceomarginata]